MTTIRTALVGVGNCASALIQGLYYYRRRATATQPHVGCRSTVAGYELTDIEIVAAFDVHRAKVGRDLSDAIFVAPNCATKICDVPTLSVRVERGPQWDGLNSRLRQFVPVDDNQEPVNVLEVLKRVRADVVVILLPSGAREATVHYVDASIQAGSAVVNGIPVDIANDATIAQRAAMAGVPIIGDDIKSQVGATIVHRVLAALFPLRSGLMDRTIQLDWGGDMDFCNLTSDGRYELGKRRSKTEPILWGQQNGDVLEAQISAVDYVPFLKDTKEAYIRIEGRVFGERPISIQLMLSAPDAYNSAGILVDAIRAAKWAKDHGRGGVFQEAASAFCKRPPHQMEEHLAHRALDELLGDR